MPDFPIFAVAAPTLRSRWRFGLLRRVISGLAGLQLIAPTPESEGSAVCSLLVFGDLVIRQAARFERTVARQWARRGSRPRQPADQRYRSAYLFGAICRARGVGAGLALHFADTEAMQLHIDEIRRHVASGARRAAHGPRRLAHHRQPRNPRQHHADLAAPVRRN